MAKGGSSTATTNSGFGEFAPEFRGLFKTGLDLYESGELGRVANWDPLQGQAQQAGAQAAGRTDGLERNLITTANTYNGGLEQTALRDAQFALGNVNDAYGRSGGLDGARHSLSQLGLQQDLGAKLGGLRQAGEQQNFQNRMSALGAQGTGANQLAAIGQGRQDFQQRQLDAPYTAWAQVLGPLTGISPRETTNTKNSGGGKG